MMFYSFFTLLFAASTSAVISRRAENDTSGVNNVPGAYIVRFASGHNSVDTFYQNLSATGIDSVHRQTFDTNVLPGTSLHLSDECNENLETILSFDQVESISPVTLFSLMRPVGKNEKNVGNHLSRTVVDGFEKRGLGIGNDSMSTHVMTGVDKVHKEGLDGSGITIAIIDTGIDYTHPALGGCFGPGCKVAFGYDLVGDNYSGSNTPVPDSDPLDCEGHGTHVAGIIAAANDPYVLGVAPNVTLGIYKVFGCSDSPVASDVLINAFTMAHNHGVDLITASIGFANGWAEEPVSAAVAAIVAAGTPCTLAAGNDGAKGLFYASSPSTGTDVTSVGSVENEYIPQVLDQGTYSIDGSAQTVFGNSLTWGSWENISLPIWANTYDTTVTDDGCNGFGNANLTGKILLVRRGTCTFDTKAAAAVRAGTSYMMIYNNLPGTFDALVDDYNIDAAGMVDSETGETWIAALAAGKEVVLTFNSGSPLLIDSPGPLNAPTGGYMDSFSTWGLSNDLTIKPVVSAPGGSVLSTYLTSAGGYQVESGTSMATPFIAGVVALFKQSKAGEPVSPQEINAALAASATPLEWYDGVSGLPYLGSVGQQGAGLVNAYQMIHAELILSQANIALNDTVNFRQTAEISVKNTGFSEETYTLSHEPACNAYLFTTPAATKYSIYPPPVDTFYSDAIITPSTLTLQPGESQAVSLSVTPSSLLNTTQIPLLSGYLALVSATNTTYRIPYAGLGAPLSSIPIVVPNTAFFSSVFNPSQIPFNGTTVRGYTPSKSLTFYATLNWVTSNARIDLVGVNVTNTVTVEGLETVGSVPGFPKQWIGRSTTALNAPFNGTLAGGGKIASGVYKFVLRVKKSFEGEEVYTSANFFMDMK